jgi:4-hydroxybenzoate polyprenyltransferase
MLPCWWGVALAAPGSFPIKFLFLFALGATAMRSAGCTFNDLIDRDIDRHVTRTKIRPLTAGEISSRQAFLFFCVQCLGGLVVLFYLPPRCWPLSLIGLGLLVIYPFMKRVTHWPQLILGFAFNLGVIFGAAVITPYEAINWPATLTLYGVGITWTLAYDTIYALQDKEDDLKIGVKSTAIQFGDRVKTALVLIYALMFALLAAVGYFAKGNMPYYVLVGVGAVGTMIRLHPLNPKNSADCLKAFNANPSLGWLIWVALLLLGYP